MYRLHELLLILWRADVGNGVLVLRNTPGAIVRLNISRHAAQDPTFPRVTGDIRNIGDSGAVLADRRVGRQGEHASAT